MDTTAVLVRKGSSVEDLWWFRFKTDTYDLELQDA